MATEADDLKRRQLAGQQFESKLLLWLIDYGPAGELRINDIKQLSFAARQLAFDEFSRPAREATAP